MTPLLFLTQLSSLALALYHTSSMQIKVFQCGLQYFIKEGQGSSFTKSAHFAQLFDSQRQYPVKGFYKAEITEIITAGIE